MIRLVAGAVFAAAIAGFILSQMQGATELALWEGLLGRVDDLLAAVDLTTPVGGGKTLDDYFRRMDELPALIAKLEQERVQG